MVEGRLKVKERGRMNVGSIKMGRVQIKSRREFSVKYVRFPH